jgi:hypothetical protein
MSALSDTKSERLMAALHAMERRWGPNVVFPARTVPKPAVRLSTGFDTLDQLVGDGGMPLHAITLLVGQATSGKLTVAYKILGKAQESALMERRHSVAILDLGASTDPDYLARAGVDLDRLLLVRPLAAQQALRVLLDLVRSRELRAILVDSLPDLMVDREAATTVEQMMPQVNLALKSADCAVLILDEPQPPWLPWQPTGTSRAVRHYASLHIEITREAWIESEEGLRGYRVQAKLLKSRGPRSGATTSIAIEFDQTVVARETW